MFAVGDLSHRQYPRGRVPDGYPAVADSTGHSVLNWVLAGAVGEAETVAPTRCKGVTWVAVPDCDVDLLVLLGSGGGNLLLGLRAACARAIAFATNSLFCDRRGTG